MEAIEFLCALLAARMRQAGLSIEDQSPQTLERLRCNSGRFADGAAAGGSSRLSIVIVTYNSASVLPGLLDSLPAGLKGIKQFETIVVDNDSADNSVDIALAHAIRPKVIRMGRNAGYAAAINAAAATVRPDLDLLILNPDVRLLPGAARLLVDRLTDSSVGVAVPRILAEDGTTQWSLRREPSLMTAWTDAILGGALAARIGTGETIGDPAIYDRGGLIEWATGAVLAVAARARSVVGDWDESVLSLQRRGRLPAKGTRKRIFGGLCSTSASGSHRKRIFGKSPSVGAHDRQSNPILPALPRAAVNGCVQAKHRLWGKQYAPFADRGTEPHCVQRSHPGGRRPRVSRASLGVLATVRMPCSPESNLFSQNHDGNRAALTMLVLQAASTARRLGG